MATVLLSWTPSEATSVTSQNIEYKQSSDSTWTIHSTVSNLQGMATVDNLNPNTSYDFRIVSICGGIKIESKVITITVGSPGNGTTNRISPTLSGSNILFVAQFNVASNIIIRYDWMAVGGAGGTGLVTMEGGMNTAVGSPGGGPISYVVITSINPPSDGTYTYTF